MAVTPEAGATAEMTGDGFTDIKGGPLTQEEAIARISARLQDPPKEEEQASEAETPREKEQPQEAAEEEAEEQPQSEEVETDETEPEEGDAEELPETLSDFAKALEMEPDDLATHLKVPIKVNGQVSEVSLEEAIRGYQREQDYSQKTSEVSEQRRQMEAQAQAFEQERTQKLTDLGHLYQALSQRVGGYTNEVLMRIYQEHGQDAYMQAKTQQEHDENLLKSVREEGEKLSQEQQKKVAEHRAAQQTRLSELDADFRDPGKAEAAQKEMATYLKGKEFTDDEIRGWFNGPFDARHVQVIRDAARYRSLMEKSKTVGKTAPKAKPKMKKAGSAVDHTPPAKLSSLRQRVRKARTGSRSDQRDANVAMISEMIRGK